MSHKYIESTIYTVYIVGYYDEYSDIMIVLK